MRGRVLVVDHTTPTPDQDSGSESTFCFLQILCRSGFDVTFAPFDLGDGGPYTKALNDLGIATLAVPRWPSIQVAVETLAPHFDILLLYRAPVAAQLIDLARRAAPATRILFHTVDLHFLRMERQAALSGDREQAQVAQAMRVAELAVIGKADATIVVSDFERALLRDLAPQAAVHHVPLVRAIPRRPFGHALRQSYGRLGRWLDGRDRSLEKRRDLLFIGGYAHSPNVDAVLWFVGSVWPLLREIGFTQRFVIAGSRMPPEIAALASEDIEVRGYVRQLGPLFAACRLSVAPLRYGGGIKGKIVTSLSHGVPVVATSIAAEGMSLRHDTDVLLADTPQEMARQIMRLYHDGDLWRQLSANGYQTFKDNFSLAAGAGKILAVMDGLMASAAG